jgi:hypothetical protein
MWSKITWVKSWSEVMTQKFVILAAAAAVAVTSLAAPSGAEAGVHHRFYGHFVSYRFAPWYAPHYGYGAPYGYGVPYRYFDRLGSNLNPDRQMVGIGE